MASLAEIPRLSARAIERFREALRRPEPIEQRQRIAEFRDQIERYEILFHFTKGLATMMKAFLSLLRAFIDAKIDHAITAYHANNHADASRAIVREVNDKAAAVDQAAVALDHFAESNDPATEK
jgi:hypothetical protein